MKRFVGSSGWSGKVGVTRAFLRSASAVSMVLLALIILDLVFYAIGSWTPLSLDYRVWGTYAAWASAILPTAGLVATVSMWMVGQRERDRRDSLDSAALLRLEKHEGAVAALFNGSDWPAVVVSTQPDQSDFDGLICRPGGPRVLLSSNTLKVRVRVRGFQYELDDKGDIRSLD